MSRLPSGVAELRPVHKENPQVCRGSFQLQHRDVVRDLSAEQGSWDIHSLLGASGRPVSSQVHPIDPNLTLIRIKMVVL